MELPDFLMKHLLNLFTNHLRKALDVVRTVVYVFEMANVDDDLRLAIESFFGIDEVNVRLSLILIDVLASLG